MIPVKEALENGIINQFTDLRYFGCYVNRWGYLQDALNGHIRKIKNPRAKKIPVTVADLNPYSFINTDLFIRKGFAQNVER